MRPETLDELGLVAALGSYIEDFNRRTDFEVRFNHRTLKPIFSFEVEIHIYRIVLEALTNVMKHSQASDQGNYDHCQHSPAPLKNQDYFHHWNAG